MSGSPKQLLALGALLASSACADLTGSSGDPLELSPAFQTVPAGFSANSSSFDASGDAGVPFLPGAMERPFGLHDRGGNGGNKGPDGGHRDGFGGQGLRGLLMGGGIGPDFIGAIAFGKGRGRGPFGIFNLPDSCTFSESSGRVTCPDITKHGLTIKLSVAYKDKDAKAQAAFDTITTNSVNVQTDVSGSRSREDGTASATLSHSSDRTVGGLAAGSTERTVNGTSKAHETVTGTRDDVKFTAVRDAADTTRNVVIPIVEGRPTIPSSGVVIRTMTVTITPEGGTAMTKSRREEIIFDGTNVVVVKITQDGVTKNCTMTLPRKKLSCE
jgi:hypothetical protein